MTRFNAIAPTMIISGDPTLGSIIFRSTAGSGGHESMAADPARLHPWTGRHDVRVRAGGPPRRAVPRGRPLRRPLHLPAPPLWKWIRQVRRNEQRLEP